jgi:phage shock protein PspC (stress-responsive transcriptional regulator)
MPNTPASAPPRRSADVRQQELPAPRLWRSRSNRVVFGVIGGLAEKLGWEVKPLRILAGLLGVLTLPLGALPVVIPYLTLLAITRARGPATPSKPFRRSRDNHMIAGVLGGAAEWLGAKPTLVRVAYGALTIATLGLPGIVTYLVLWAKTPVADAPATR